MPVKPTIDPDDLRHLTVSNFDKANSMLDAAIAAAHEKFPEYGESDILKLVTELLFDTQAVTGLAIALAVYEGLSRFGTPAPEPTEDEAIMMSLEEFMQRLTGKAGA